MPTPGFPIGSGGRASDRIASRRCTSLGILFVFGALFLSSSSRAQSILTIAGGGTDHGRTATLAKLALPGAVVVDASGNLYIADTENHRIRKVDARTQIITTLAGNGAAGFSGDGGPATEAALSRPESVAIDTSGNLFIADTFNVRIRKIDAVTRIITTVAGSGVLGFSGDDGPATAATLRGPTDVAVDASGNLYIADTDNFRVRKVDAVTKIITTVAGSGTFGFFGDGGPATAAGLSIPKGVAVGDSGNLYISDAFWGRIRKVDAVTKFITTVAGTGGSMIPADGTPATQAAVRRPVGVAVDASENLYIADTDFHRIWKVDALTQTIATVAGGLRGFSGDGGPAIGAALRYPSDVVLDASGNLYIADAGNHRIRKVAVETKIIGTVAGSGGENPSGDGGLAIAAFLARPNGATADASGNVYIADTENNRIRKVDAVTKIIATAAGSGAEGFSGDGGPATAAALNQPVGVAVDTSGNLYIADTFNGRIRKVDGGTKIITTVAGSAAQGFSGDGGPGTAAALSSPSGVAVDPSGNLYIADAGNGRIRKVDAVTRIITTVAGGGSLLGDGSPATAAGLGRPHSVAVDASGNLYIAESTGQRIRKVDAVTQIITRVAGTGIPGVGADGGPATSSHLFFPRGVAVDRAGNVYIADTLSHRIRKVDVGTKIITTLAGVAIPAFSGDGGPVTAAVLSLPVGVAVDASGNLFIADTNNNRIRAVLACVQIGPPVLLTPADSAAGLSTAPALTWSSVAGAFRYDLFVDTSSFPAKLVASDLTATVFTPSNLLPGTKYFWRVVAKGDPFCQPVSTNSSAVRSFTTAVGCGPPAPIALSTPTDGAINVGSSPLLSWQPSNGAVSYDVLLGPSSPPPFFASTNSTSLTAPSLAAGTTYFWNVVARAACDPTQTTSAELRSFRVGGGCEAPGSFDQVAPASGQADVPTTTPLRWSASANATSYDLYFGTTNPPTVYLPDLTTTTVTISSLVPATTYFWRVIARTGCDSSRTTSTPVARFTVRSSCVSPRPTSFRFTPPGNVAVGQTYVVAWQEAADLQADGYYVVERAADASFSNITDAQQTAATFASFIASTTGTYFHRVRPVNPCSTGSGLAVQSTGLTVVSSPPNVVFTVQPEAILTTLGQNLEDKRGRFVIENISTEAIPVIIGRQEIDSVPFFSISDPLGGDSTFITLDPRKPKEFEIRFSGPPNDRPASYQGVIFLAALGKGLANTPYAFVNLRVGGGEAAAPQFRSGGTATEYSFFPGFAGDDANRPPITVDIYNPGTTPMELGAEVGPEVWLIPESGWNESAIPPGATRTVRLSTRRNRAPHGSALPRYTYFTVRTRAGQSARLLVQDNGVEPTSSGRGSALDPSIRSYIVPEVISTDSRTFSTLRLSNFGSEAVQADLFFTPSDADGFDVGRVRRATIAIPPNDIVTLTDPPVQVWALARPAKGQIEVRTAPGKIGLVTVRATVTQFASGGGAFAYTVPSIGRQEGAQAERPHEIVGISTTSDTRSVLTVAETSGTDRAQIRVSLFDSDGNKKGERIVELARYSMTEIDEVTAALGGGNVVTALRLELRVISGAGSVIGIVKLLDRSNGGGATLISRPVETGVGPSTRRALDSPQAAFATFILPAVFNAESFRTVVGLAALRDTTNFTLTYVGSDGTRTATVTVAARSTIEYANVLEQPLGIAPGTTTEGTLTVEASAPADVYGRLRSVGSLASVSQTLPVLRGDSESVISNHSQLPLYIDGLDQSVDRGRGSQWMLILNELGGQGATLVARLYEAGNRSSPIAIKEFTLAAQQRMKLDNLFASMDLDNGDRRKDRANILLSVAFKSGAGAAAVLAMSIDNRTGDSKSYILTPAGGSALGVQKVTAVAPRPTGRRRAAGR